METHGKNVAGLPLDASIGDLPPDKMYPQNRNQKDITLAGPLFDEPS